MAALRHAGLRGRGLLLLWHLLLLWLSSTLVLVPPACCSADFLSVRTSQHEDHSGGDGAAPDKYFHESTFHHHYDGRFAHKALPDGKRIAHLTGLARSYLATMSDLGLETWIMHGTLLSWWWNQKIFPWDSDLDVQVAEGTMHFLARYYNMTEHRFSVSGAGDRPTRAYLLEINPNFINRSTDDRENVIDARWIDTSSGLFIDITCVTKSPKLADTLMSKDRHRYKKQDIFPLRNSYFEGRPVKIPFNYKDLLVNEYGPDSISKTLYKHHRFNETTQLWDPVESEPK